MLFGSTVLIPEMLQTLFGYTATDAGLVLGSGRGRDTSCSRRSWFALFRKIGAKRLLGVELYHRGALDVVLQRPQRPD